MKDTSKLLPIGSVVLLNNGTKKIMITGFYSIAANDKNTVHDYCGCLFPEGVISSEQNLLFNHNQIMKVCYMGYTNDEEKEFKNKLGEIINGGSQSQQTPQEQTQTVDNSAPNNTIEEIPTAANMPQDNIVNQ